MILFETTFALTESLGELLFFFQVLSPLIAVVRNTMRIIPKKIKKMIWKIIKLNPNPIVILNLLFTGTQPI